MAAEGLPRTVNQTTKKSTPSLDAVFAHKLDFIVVVWAYGVRSSNQDEQI